MGLKLYCPWTSCGICRKFSNTRKEKPKKQDGTSSTLSRKLDAPPWYSQHDISREFEVTMIGMFMSGHSVGDLVLRHIQNTKYPEHEGHAQVVFSLGRAAHRLRSHRTELLPTRRCECMVRRFPTLSTSHIR